MKVKRTLICTPVRILTFHTHMNYRWHMIWLRNQQKITQRVAQQSTLGSREHVSELRSSSRKSSDTKSWKKEFERFLEYSFYKKSVALLKSGPFEFPAQLPYMLLITQSAPKCFKVHQSALGVLYRAQECSIVTQVGRTKKREIQMVPDLSREKNFL